MFYTYILYSQSLDRFYVGYTSQPLEERLKKHLSSHSGYTSRAKDWEIAYYEMFENKHSAIKREKEIKNWKSKEKVLGLVKNFG